MQKLIFYVHNVVLDTILLAFFFTWIFFSKTLKNGVFMYALINVCYVENQKFKIIIIEKFCQKLKVCYFC